MPPVSLEILERNIFFLISCFSVILLLNSHILLCVTFPTKSYFQCILHFDLSFSFLPFKLTNSRSPALAIFQNFVFYIGVQLINNVVMTSGVQQSGSVIHMYLSILFHILFPFNLLHNIKQSSMFYEVGPCWLSILFFLFLFFLIIEGALYIYFLLILQWKWKWSRSVMSDSLWSHGL